MSLKPQPSPRVAILFVAPLALAACQEQLQCTSVSVVERLNVKLDREIKENGRFLAPHEPDLSRFDVGAVAPSGNADGALACNAKLHAVLDASQAFAKTHGFRPPPHPLELKRDVRFTAHRGGWDTYVEVVAVAAPPVLPSDKRAGGPSR